MTLQIRDDRARALAEKLANKRRITMTEAVIQALEAELQRETAKEPLAKRISRIADDLVAAAGPNRRAMSKDGGESIWGQD